MMSVYDELRMNKIELEQAKQLSKVANTIVNTGRIILDYQKMKSKNEKNTSKVSLKIFE
jgi:hypothetical protein